MESTVQWCDLPDELLGMIAQRLKSRIDVLRFRSVCISWRHSFLSPASHISSPLSLKFPFPVLPNRHSFYKNLCGSVTLSQSTIYRLSSSSSSSSSKGWLVRVKEEGPNKIRMLSTLADFHFLPLPPAFPKVLNISDLRVSELCKAYHFHSKNGLDNLNRRYVVPNISKVAVLSSNAVQTLTNNYALMAIYNHGRLGFLKAGDEEWRAIDEQNSDYSDVFTYKGKFCAVNNSGRAVVTDSILKMTEIASPICDAGGHQKHLVESSGDLLLVDRYLHEFIQTVVQFRVYKLNEEDHKWVEMRSLGDRVLFLGKDCSFSASAPDFAGCKQNSIYYMDHQCSITRVIRANNNGVFDLEDDPLHPLAFCPGYSHRFWPLATRVKPKSLPYVC